MINLKMYVGRFFFFWIIWLSYIEPLAFGATLVSSEVKALEGIAKTLGKKDWNFNVDPCTGWRLNQSKGSENAVTCNCTFTHDTVCHVISIVLKSQDLLGVPPPELVKLQYLEEIDLTRTYLKGTIPKEWGSMKLINISLTGNGLSGMIPNELANISTLKKLVLDMNQLSGISPKLGNLVGIELLHLSSNNFTGELPKTFANLTNLKDFRINDNHFTGRLPDFIQNWTKLDRLEIMASGFEGPIPSGISLLTKLTNLRISDINLTNFPPLNNLTKMKTLILRNCNITGVIPDYLGGMANLKMLDLSFNKLVGQIPDSFKNLRLEFVYLTQNSLNGTVQDWMKQKNYDLSYTNYLAGSSGESGCQLNNLNLFKSSSPGNNFEVAPCLNHCRKKRYSFHINCGGAKFDDGKLKYDGDEDNASPSKFFQSQSNWAFSSTGNFLDINGESSYTGENKTILSMKNNQLYTKARLSPLSLTYFGFCLENGNYTVYLHFAEIMFTNDNYSSFGRRLFDVYIQGNQELKDFNIVDEAGGIGKETIKNFTAVVNTSGTLEIRFYWAGKGTTGIPVRGTYGPLVSAISVKSIFDPPSKLSTAAVVGIVVASVSCAIFVIIGTLWWKGCLGRKSTIDEDLRGLDLQTGSFTLRQIKAATNNFDIENKIGEGGFGPVYKGHLLDGTIIAVKQLSSKSKQGNREFVNEIGMISALQHPNLVRLYGCCIEGRQLLLIYEYMENNSLARALFGSEEYQLKLDWLTRHKICVGIARGLAYLHEESTLKIVHRDIKATNVLLDKDLEPKISDFGLAKLDEEDNTHISTRIAGTLGYMAPEYALRGYLTDKADVYSFGVVAMEIVSGRSNTSPTSKEDGIYLLDWALVLKEKGNLMELVDPRLGTEFNREEVLRMINVAFLCTNASSILRPTMSAVVSMLEGRTIVQEFVSDLSMSRDELKFEAFRNRFQQYQNPSTNESQIQSESQTQSMLDGPWSGSSTSAKDLYPYNPDSSYWNNRE